jgi:hypothetical protein
VSQATATSHTGSPPPDGRPGGREAFIYYRVQPANAAALHAAVSDWHAALMREVPRLRARVLVRAADDATAQQTWMETYAIDAAPNDAANAGIDDALLARIAREARVFAPLIDGARHVETFQPPPTRWAC